MKTATLLMVFVVASQASSRLLHRVNRDATPTCNLFCNSAVATSGCGSTVPFTNAAHPGVSIPAYVFSADEMYGQCCRANMVHQNLKYSVNVPGSLDSCKCRKKEGDCFKCVQGKFPADNQTCCGTDVMFVYGPVKYPMHVPGKSSCCTAKGISPTGQATSACYCEASATECFAPGKVFPTTTPIPITTPTTTTTTPTTTTPTTTTTTTSTTPSTTTPTTTSPTTTTSTTTTTPTTTTTTPATTTTTPTTTTTTPTTTTTTPTTTTSTTTATTTPAKLCPAYTHTIGRILGGTEINPCGTGVVRFNTSFSVVCNGVYAYNKQNALVPKVYLPKRCYENMEQIIKMKITDINVFAGNIQFKYENASTTHTDFGSAFTALTFPNTSCLVPACVYNPSTMKNELDTSSCYLQSFGADFENSTTRVISGSLNQLNIHLDKSACKDDYGLPAKCFVSDKQGGYTCLGDYGAPVFCSLKATGEKVLYGLMGYVKVCGPSSTSLPVLPIAP